MFKFKLMRTLAICAALTAALSASAFAASIGGATVSASALNLRTEPSTQSSSLTTAPRGSVVVVGAAVDQNWYKVVYKGAVGYMSSEYLDFSQVMDGSFGSGNINGSDVRMRSAAGTSASILATYPVGTRMQVLGVSGEWYKVSYNGAVGYVHSDYFALNGGISDIYSGTGSAPAAPSDPEYSAAGQTIIDAAKKYMGVPYVWAGTSPSGFDCSGFVYYVYKECGYAINRTAASIYENGVFVEKSDLKIGDAICFASSSNYIGHVGIYIGGGEFIHASSSSGQVTINRLDENYYTRNYVGARHIV